MAGNTITLAGNVTRAPDLRATPGGKFVLNFRLAVNGAGDNKDAPGFFECVAWGDLAENLANSLSKGDRVIVAGMLKQREFEVDGGGKRSVTELLVQDAGPSLLWARASLAKQVSVKKAS